MNREHLVKEFWINHDKLKTLDPQSEDYDRVLSENDKLVDLIVGDI